MDLAKFLTSVWDAHGHSSGYVFVSYKTAEGDWRDKALPYPITVSAVDKVLVKLRRKGATDLYFCPNIFRDKSRRKGHVLESVWLYADLDPVEPTTLSLAATSAWETSPGRFQCLWRVNRPLKEHHHATLNQRLTYLHEADKGGWSVTKVLRCPGTKNYKRDEVTKGRLLWHDLQRYEVRTVLEVVRHVKVLDQQTEVRNLDVPDMTADAVIHKHREKLPERALELLRAKKARVGERSDRLWELECLMLQAKVPPEEVLVAVRFTVWNKYAGQRRELPQLWAEIKKALKHVESDTFADVGELRLTPYRKFLETPIPEELWTVEGIWSHDAHGLIAGEPKTFKSFVATDLAVSVASGTKFLGHFEVPETGPVILIQEENTPAMMKDRLWKIASSRDLAGGVSRNGSSDVQIQLPQELPIFLMNNQRFNLTDEEHVGLLESWIKEVEPKLVVLDPIYLMMPGVDENSAVAMTPILRDLLTLKQRYDVGILIVHHYNKPRSDEDRHPGLRISGTSVFYRWFESALYLSKGSQPGEVVMVPEHRGAAPAGSIHVEFDLGEMGESDYHTDVEIRSNVGTNHLRRTVLDKVLASPGITLNELCEETGVSKDRIHRLVERHPSLTMKRSQSKGKAGRPPLQVFPLARATRD